MCQYKFEFRNLIITSNRTSGTVLSIMRFTHGFTDTLLSVMGKPLFLTDLLLIQEVRMWSVLTFTSVQQSSARQLSQTLQDYIDDTVNPP